MPFKAEERLSRLLSLVRRGKGTGAMRTFTISLCLLVAALASIGYASDASALKIPTTARYRVLSMCGQNGAQTERKRHNNFVVLKFCSVCGIAKRFSTILMR